MRYNTYDTIYGAEGFAFMGKGDKLYDRFFQRPFRNDITLEEVKTFLATYGYSIRKKFR